MATEEPKDVFKFIYYPITLCIQVWLVHANVYMPLKESRKFEARKITPNLSERLCKPSAEYQACSNIMLRCSQSYFKRKTARQFINKTKNLWKM